MAKELPINLRIVEQLAKATIRNLPDGIVELVTNADDSYRRLEERDTSAPGRVEIHVDRKKGGFCRKLAVVDLAEGMSSSELERALEFAGETSGFGSGRTVRGLFGRGLKETIIALGDGKITTIKDGKLACTELWLDQVPLYDEEMLSETRDTDEQNGTSIEITITNKKIRIPEYGKFSEQITRHYALRDINSSTRREIILHFEDLKRSQRNQTRLSFTPPSGIEVAALVTRLPVFGDRITVAVYESREPLESPRNNPYGLAGILIKTRAAILDNQLFRFDGDPAALYFYGHAVCVDLEERLRRGETEIIDPNRGGLEWRHEYCQALSRAIERILEPLILEKRKELHRKPRREVPASTRRMLKKLCSLLNRMAKEELEEFPEVVVDPGPDIASLAIKPEVANIPRDKPRTFSIYARESLVREEGDRAHIRSDNVDIHPLSSTVTLERHRKYPGTMWYRYFKVVGVTEGARGTITVGLGKTSARARLTVAPPGKSRRGDRGGKPGGRQGGFISDIVPDDLPDPPQRAVYQEGMIRVYTRFPSVSRFIGSGLEGAETMEGRVLLAELVGEAFCRELARQGMELGKYPTVPGGEVDAFNAAMDELQKKYLHLVQDLVFAWKFQPITAYVPPLRAGRSAGMAAQQETSDA